MGGYGSVGDGGGGASDEQLMLSDLPEPPIAVSDVSKHEKLLHSNEVRSKR